MATGRSFSIFANHSIRQPINPKTGFSVTSHERNSAAKKADGGKDRDGVRQANNSAPLRASIKSGA